PVEAIRAATEVGASADEHLDAAGHQRQRRLGPGIAAMRGIRGPIALIAQPQDRPVLAAAFVHGIQPQARHEGGAADHAAAADPQARARLQAGGVVEIGIDQVGTEAIDAGPDPAGTGHGFDPDPVAEAQAGLQAHAPGAAFDAAAQRGFAGAHLAAEAVDLDQALGEERAPSDRAVHAHVGTVEFVPAGAAGEVERVVRVARGQPEQGTAAGVGPGAVVAGLHTAPAALGG